MEIRTMAVRMLIAAGFVMAMTFHAPGMANAVVLKYATIIPDGGPTSAENRAMFNRLRKETNGEIEVKIYAGAVAGDEVDIIRKMRVSRIHLGMFTGNGLGEIYPEIRVLECPGLFTEYAEEEYAKAKMFDYFAEGFEKKGFVLLQLGGGGFVYIFLPKAVTDPREFGQFKMWTWKGDPLAQTFMEDFGMNTVPLHIADVVTALDTGMIDAFYVIPGGATALQWYPRARYMIDYRISIVTGALLINKTAFDLLSEQSRNILKQVAAESMDASRKEVLKMDAESMEIIKKSGVQILTPTAEQLEEYDRRAKQTVENAIARGRFPRELYEKIVTLLAEYRASRK